MKIKVKMKGGHTVSQPTAHPWSYGWIVGFVTHADSRGYAVVQTEHGEFESVMPMSLRAMEE